MSHPVLPSQLAVLDPTVPSGPERRRRDNRPIQAAAGVGIVGLAIVAAVTIAGAGTPHTSAGVRDDGVLVGTIAQPALQSQGVPVKIMLPHGSVVATVTGPETPGQGLPFQATFTTTTWSVHVSDATTDVPLSLSDFDTIDHGGVIGHPVVVPGTTPPPAILKPGQSVTFRVRESMALGEGLFRYAPNGNNIEAKWDFEVEND